MCVDALQSTGALMEGSLEDVANILGYKGHRFAAKRAEYIVKARSFADNIKEIVQGFETISEARQWLVYNIKGLGWKEASHFLRNVGYLDLAILDRHIISNMREYGLICRDEPKTLTKKRYVRYEQILRRLAERVGMKLGAMDLYLWYRKTGKVLK